MTIDKSMQYDEITNSKGVTMAETIGSIEQFIKENNLEGSNEAHHLYSVALAGLREHLAAEKGVTLEELHTMPFTDSSTSEN